MHRFLLLLLPFLPVTVLAQSAQQWTAWGDSAMAHGEYYGASRFYAGALEVEPTRMALQWKQAEACRLSNQYDKAVVHYEEVQRKDMGHTHPDALRWIAEMWMCTGDYAKADAAWRKVKQRAKRTDTFTVQRAANGIAGCALAEEALRSPKEVDVEHLPQPVNTYDSEFGARIGPDSLLHFSSLRGAVNAEGEVEDTSAYHTAIFTSREQGASWDPAQPLPSPINGAGDNANSAWTSDGSRVLFTRCLSGTPCRIHIAQRTATGWSEALPLAGLSPDALSTQPMVVRRQGEELLFFVSDAPGGEGGTDIWQAHLVDGTVRDVQPLGRPVNSPGNERSPWYDQVTNTLYYSSDFLPGMGGYDIFSASYGNDTYASPVNAGHPLNSPANDLYPSYDPLRNEGWLTSNRKGSFAAKGETCCNDLYRFRQRTPPIVVIEPPPPTDTLGTPSITEAVQRLTALQHRFPLKLYFHNDEPEPRSWSTTTPQTYDATYRAYKALLPVYEREQEDRAPLDAFMTDEVDHGQRMLLELIAAMKPLLADGQRITLDVRGHASPLAKSDYNRNLSLRRIESLRNELRAVDRGDLAAYMDSTAANGGVLVLRELPFGEDRSATGVSDDLRDLKRSVYSVAAARERRIEIERVGVIDAGNDAPREEQRTQRVGELRQGRERAITFLLKNEGTRPMHLLSSKADCGCTTARLPEGIIAPGAEVPVDVVFSGRAPEGPLRRTVTIETDGTPSRFVLTIDGTVVP